MSADYLGTFPVRREVSRFVDPEGIITATMLVTDRIDSITSSAPGVDSLYELDSSLRVTQVDFSYPGNGLAEASVTCQGCSATSTPRVTVSVGGPFIFGLAPGLGDASGLPRFSPANGQVVEVTFSAPREEREGIYAQYYDALMPEDIFGVALPVAARQPGPFNENNPISPPPQPTPAPPIPGVDSNSISGSYYGFRCRQISFEAAGSATRVRLYFREGGFMIAGGRMIFEV